MSIQLKLKEFLLNASLDALGKIHLQMHRINVYVSKKINVLLCGVWTFRS